MLSKTQERQFGELGNFSYAGAALSITAGAGQDGLEQNTPWVLIPDGGGKKRPLSAVLGLVFTSDLDDTETLSLVEMNGQHASDASGTDAEDFDTEHSIIVPVVLATGLSGGTTATGGFRSPTLNLVGADVAIRFQWTVDLSRGATDTVVVNPVILWGGYSLEPTDAVVADANS